MERDLQQKQEIPCSCCGLSLLCRQQILSVGLLACVKRINVIPMAMMAISNYNLHT